MANWVCTVALLSVSVIVGCGGSTTVVVEEEAIRDQIAKVEVQERVQRDREAATVPAQQQPQSAGESDPSQSGAEGSN